MTRIAGKLEISLLLLAGAGSDLFAQFAMRGPIRGEQNVAVGQAHTSSLGSGAHYQNRARCMPHHRFSHTSQQYTRYSVAAMTSHHN
jgi:hypothetical protein